MYPEFGPIPKDFHSFETGEAFKNCSVCHTDLFKPNTNYLIEKAFKKKETLFEYAICYECYLEFQKSLSKKSRELVDNYLEEHVDIEKRTEQMFAKYGRRTRSWLGHCMIRGTPRWKCEEHQIYGWFVDNEMAFNGPPYMLSGAVIDDIVERLSPETIGALNDFSDKLFGIDLPQGFVLI